MNFLCFGGNRVNIQGISTDEATRKSVQKFLKILQFSFFFINVCVKCDNFALTVRERKSLSMCNFSKKFSIFKAPNIHF